MRSVSVHIEGVTPYSQSRQHETPKLKGETSDDHEQRTWREKCTCDANNQVVIPAMALKQSLDTASKKLGLQIPGKGKSTYAKYFTADVFCNSDVPLGVSKNDVVGVRVYCNSDGIRGSGKRVWRTFPVIPQWEAVAEFTVLDDTVSRDVFEQVMKVSASSIGIGRFRPEKGGLNGRFRVTRFEWLA
jgi:hypothetical protein